MRQLPATNPVCCTMRRKWPALVTAGRENHYCADGQVRLLHHLSQSIARTATTTNHRPTALNDGRTYPPPKQRSPELETRAAETLRGATNPYTLHSRHSAVQPFPTNLLRRSARPLISPTPPRSRTFLERSSSSSTRTSAPTPLSPDAYHGLADKFFHNLIRRLEALQEERDDVDSDYSAGVLTITFPPHGTYVINKQPPNKQIWLSSPVSGPKRYDWLGEQPRVEESKKGEDGSPVVDDVAGDWVYMRDGSLLSELLKGELGVDMDSKLEGDE
ncbi:MAG: hypothetical protein Q9214_000869 [Letrouitia sp. 1 TL-2023]